MARESANRVRLEIHLKLSSDFGSDRETDLMFRLDSLMDTVYGAEYDGNDIGEGEFVLYFAPRDAHRILAEFRERITEHAMLRGSYAVVRRTRAEEETEQIVPLAGAPIMPAEKTSVRTALSFGLVDGGKTSKNEALLDRIHHLSKLLDELPQAGAEEATLIVVWSVVGDVYSPVERSEKVTITNKGERQLGASVHLPYGRIEAEEVDRCIRESLDRVIPKAEQLLRRRKLDWDLNSVRETATTVVP